MFTFGLKILFYEYTDSLILDKESIALILFIDSIKKNIFIGRNKILKTNENIPYVYNWEIFPILHSGSETKLVKCCLCLCRWFSVQVLGWNLI